LVHISELAQRHVDLPEQVVTVDQDVFVKVIDIDLDRHRISLSLKQANEGVDPEGDDTTFDPALYGMAAEYDATGEYKYHEGYEAQREEWEGQYAAAYERWTAHKAQVAEAIRADEESANAPASASTSTESAAPASQASYQSSSSDEGTLASDEALAALRAKLT